MDDIERGLLYAEDGEPMTEEDLGEMISVYEPWTPRWKTLPEIPTFFDTTKQVLKIMFTGSRQMDAIQEKGK